MDITMMIVTSIVLATAAIGVLVAKVVKPWLDLAKARLTNEQYGWLTHAASTAVLATEQTLGNASGKDKLSHAVNLVKAHLGEMGLTIDEEIVVDAVEAEVYKQLNALKAAVRG